MSCLTRTHNQVTCHGPTPRANPHRELENQHQKQKKCCTENVNHCFNGRVIGNQSASTPPQFLIIPWYTNGRTILTQHRPQRENLRDVLLSFAQDVTLAV